MEADLACERNGAGQSRGTAASEFLREKTMALGEEQEEKAKGKRNGTGVRGKDGMR